MSGNYINVWPVAAGGNWGYVGTNTGPYEGGLYIDNGGIDDNYYGMHLDGDSYGYIDPDKLPNGMQPLNIMAYAAGGVAGDEVVVTFGDPKSKITLAKTYANIVFDDNRAVCALFDELSDSGNPQFKQNCSFISDYLFKSLHQTKTVTITTGEFERPIGERFDFMITAEKYRDSAYNRAYYGYMASSDSVSGGSQRGDIDIDTLMGYEIKRLALMQVGSIDIGYVSVSIDAPFFDNYQITTIFNNNPLLLGDGVQGYIQDGGMQSFNSMMACRNDMMMPCSIYVVGQYTLSVELSDGILGMSGANTNGNLSPLELEGYTINYFGYRYSNDNAWIQFKSSDAKVFSKIYLEMDGVMFCAEKVSETSFSIVDKKDEFKAILEAHKDADITFPMYVPKVTLTKQPQNQHTLEGNGFTFLIAAKEHDSVQWQQKRVMDSNWSDIVGANELEYKGDNATLDDDESQFRAVVTFDGTTIPSDVAVLSVRAVSFSFVPDVILSRIDPWYGYNRTNHKGSISPENNNWGVDRSGNTEQIRVIENDSRWSFNILSSSRTKWSDYEAVDVQLITTSGDTVTLTSIPWSNTAKVYTLEDSSSQLQEAFELVTTHLKENIGVIISESI